MTGHPWPHDQPSLQSQPSTNCRLRAEEESLQHLSGKYYPLIIDHQMGKCLKVVLSGHRMTPWVVRFHPVHPEILASGSLDHEIRLWVAKTAECLGSHHPIASLAFHAEGELAVACGHKLPLRSIQLIFPLISLN